MKMTHLAPVLAAIAALGVAAYEKKGPAERVGEKVDHAADTIKNGGEEPTGDKIQDQANRARDKLNDAAGKDR